MSFSKLRRVVGDGEIHAPSLRRYDPVQVQRVRFRISAFWAPRGMAENRRFTAMCKTEDFSPKNLLSGVSFA
jgi:hypothetical protein